MVRFDTKFVKLRKVELFASSVKMAGFKLFLQIRDGTEYNVPIFGKTEMFSLYFKWRINISENDLSAIVWYHSPIFKNTPCQVLNGGVGITFCGGLETI